MGIDRKTAETIIQALIDQAVKSGLFLSAQHVSTTQQAFEVLKNSVPLGAESNGVLEKKELEQK